MNSMPTEHYLVVLTGHLREGRSPDQAALILSKTFGIPVEKGRALFNGTPTPMGKKLDRKLAEKICHYLHEAGADCQLKEVLETPKWSLVEMDEADTRDAKDGHESILLETSPPAARSNQVQFPSQVEGGMQYPSAKPAPPANRGSGHGPPTHRPVIHRHEAAPAPEEEAREDEPGKQAINVRNIALVLIPILALVAGGYLFLFPSEEQESKQALEPRPVKPAPALSASDLSDPALRDSEISLTTLKLKSLAQSVRVWMVQFGGGYDTDQVTVSRLQRDMGVSDDDLTDAWGNRMRYQPSKSEFSISSAGPDKAFNTVDDLVVRQER
ncbi:MAG: hypothetical protein KJ558_07810 [Gammaproteobacteria bacterium]|nr:hypothetical protein [Gammaproteobacteria bacterium]MBU1654719.1 hypothetical protein [Gammaproteobacteria bacterium]MBU1959640.1 hypothetical protein [Gammaproteobacteria bacterium]